MKPDPQPPEQYEECGTILLFIIAIGVLIDLGWRKLWGVARWFFVAMMLATLLCGCDKKEIRSMCNQDNGDYRYHQFSRWTNDWPKISEGGYMEQHRTCTNCGYIQIEFH